MKKIICFVMTLTIVLSLASVISFAKDYTAFNIVFEEKEGENVNATKITVFASVDDGALTDKTGDFTMEDVEWFKYLPEPEAGKTVDDYDYVDEVLKVYGIKCGENDVFDHENYKYFLRIARLYAKEEDTFSRNVKINGVDIDELDGLCFNAGNEFYIKTITNGHGGASDIETLTTEPPADNDNEPDDGDIADKKSKCKVCGICPVQPLGICLFIWIAIILLVIILIVLVICVIRKRQKQEDKQ